jgi:hypothetical protein
VLFAVAFSWLVVQNQQLRSGVERRAATESELRNQAETLREQVARERSSASNPTPNSRRGVNPSVPPSNIGSLLALALLPDGSRALGKPMPTLQAQYVSLNLMIDKVDFAEYKARLETAPGTVVLESPVLHSQEAGGNWTVSWDIALGSIPSDTYIIKLEGRNKGGAFEDVANYSLNIAAR